MDNEIGRFISIDPLLIELYDVDKLREMSNGDDLEMVLFNTQRLNGYSYVLNNPVIYIDPTGLAEIYIREEGPINSNEYNPSNWEEWGGHTMVKVQDTYYGFNNLNDDRFDNDVQELNQEDFEETYSGQKWHVIDIGNDYDDKIVENFQKLKDASNQEYGTYRVFGNNCTQKMWNVLAVSGVWSKNNIAPPVATTPGLFYGGLKLVNGIEKVRGFFDKSYNPLIKSMDTIKIPK